MGEKQRLGKTKKGRDDAALSRKCRQTWDKRERRELSFQKICKFGKAFPGKDRGNKGVFKARGHQIRIGQKINPEGGKAVSKSSSGVFGGGK